VKRKQIENSLEYLSKSLKYESIKFHLEEHFTFIVEKWINNNVDLEKIPFVLFGKNSFQEFFDEYIDRMVISILYKDTRLFNDVCKIVARDPKTVLTQAYPIIYSFLCFLPPSDAKYSKIQSLIEKVNLIEKETEYIILNMFWLLNLQDKSSLDLDEKKIEEGIEKFSKNLKFNSFQELLKNRKSRIHLILFCLCEKIINTKRKKFRVRQFLNLSYFLKLMGRENIQNESILRFIISIVLNVSQFLELSEYVCETLKFLISETVISKDSSREIGKNLNSIISHLTKLFDHNKEKQCLELIKGLIGHSSMKDYLKDLAPFSNSPDYVNFEKARSLSQKASSISIFDEIKKFTDDEGESDLNRICRLIKDKKSILMQDSEKDQINQNLITKLIGKLIRICSEKHEGKLEAGECLKEIGLVVPKFINSFTQDFNEIHREYEFNNISSLDVWSIENFYRESKVQILYLLDSLTTDKNLNIMKLSLILLKNILKSETGRTAYKYINADSKMYLQPFQTSKMDTENIFEKINIGDQKESEINDELFDTSNKTHEEWIMKLTYNLIKVYCKDEVYLSCAVMCLHNALFSEHMFQFALFDIYVNHKTEKSINEKLSLFLGDSVLKNPKSKGRSVRLVLNTLNTLRRHVKEEIKTNGIPKTKKPMNEFDYWLKIPYLQVARASLESNCYFTALMYVESHCEQSNISVLPDKLCYEEDMLEYQTLLLQIYQHIDEPDGIYGINRNYGLNSNILKYKHQNDYEKVLGIYDTLSQKSNQLKDSIDMTTGVFDSLKNIGYNSLLLNLMKSDSISTLVKQSPGLQDSAFELAWRKGQFDVDIQTSTDGLNKKIYRSLKALSLGESNSFWKSFKSAYLHVINQITTSNKLYVDLSHLQMLSEIEQAWKLRWKTSSDSQTMNLQPYIPKNDSEIVFFGSNGINEHPFTYIEPILSLRTTLLNIIDRKDLIPLHMCEISKMARKASRFQLASSLIHSLSLEQKKTTPLWMFEDSKLLWKLGEQDSAISGNSLQY
jgi:hypothetical protein